jgi:hypothetical protein
MGARTMVAPIAAAPNAGAMNLIVVLMMFLLFCWLPFVAVSHDGSLANECRYSYRSFNSEASWNSTFAATE